MTSFDNEPMGAEDQEPLVEEDTPKGALTVVVSDLPETQVEPALNLESENESQMADELPSVEEETDAAPEEEAVEEEKSDN